MPRTKKREPLTAEQIDRLIARLIGPDSDADERSEALMVLMDEIYTVNGDTAREIARLATRTAFTKLDEAMAAQIQLLRTEI